MNALMAPIFTIRHCTIAYSILRQHFDDYEALESDINKVCEGTGSAMGERTWIFRDNSTITRKGDGQYIPG